MRHFPAALLSLRVFGLKQAEYVTENASLFLTRRLDRRGHGSYYR